jgi:hypothetical protein
MGGFETTVGHEILDPSGALSEQICSVTFAKGAKISVSNTSASPSPQVACEHPCAVSIPEIIF